MQAPDAVPDLGRDALVSRLCGNYLLFPARAEDRFVACDAIALAELARGSVDWLNEYRAAFRSVTTGLRLRKADAVLALCTGNGMRAPELFAHLGTLEFSAAEGLLDTRRAALGLMRVGSGMLLGPDPLLGDPGAKAVLPTGASAGPCLVD